MAKKGSLIGATLLIAGCCIGASMVGLPVLSGMAGFIPSLIVLFFSWLFMAVAGLLLLEVNLWFSDEVGLVTMAERTLGPLAKGAAWFFFLALFYSLLAAYLTGGGALIAEVVEETLAIQLPSWFAVSLLCLGLGLFIYAGTRIVDDFNRLLMAGLIVSFILLIGLGSTHITPHYLLHYDWSLSLAIVPVMLTSFGFHNLVPTLTRYLGGDVRRLCRAILFGSLIPFGVYLLWELVILGLIPAQAFQRAYDSEEMVTRALRTATGSGLVVHLIEAYALFAIVTSFLAVGLSFVDFLADGLHWKKRPLNRLTLSALTLLPPLLAALFSPTLFLHALRYGGVITALLFGLLPFGMVWWGRYHAKLGKRQLVPGGRPALLLFAATALFMACYEGVVR